MAVYTVLLFGITKDLIGKKSIDLEVNEPLTVSAFLQKMKETFPSIQNLPSLRVAADHHFPSSDFISYAVLGLTIIPPVSGG